MDTTTVNTTGSNKHLGVKYVLKGEVRIKEVVLWMLGTMIWLLASILFWAFVGLVGGSAAFHLASFVFRGAPVDSVSMNMLIANIFIGPIFLALISRLSLWGSMLTYVTHGPKGIMHYVK
jgi:hypothetical protein